MDGPLPKINIIGLKMTVKSGLEKIVSEIPPRAFSFLLRKMPKIVNSVTKMTSFVHGGITINCFVMYVSTYNK